MTESEKDVAVVGSGDMRGLGALLSAMATAPVDQNIFYLHPVHEPRYPQDPGPMVRLPRKKLESVRGAKEAERRRRQIERGMLRPS